MKRYARRFKVLRRILRMREVDQIEVHIVNLEVFELLLETFLMLLNSLEVS